MRILTSILLAACCYGINAAAFQSPRQAEVFGGPRMQRIPSPVEKSHSADSVDDSACWQTNTFAWNHSPGSDGYILYSLLHSRAGSVTNSWASDANSNRVRFYWPDGVWRIHWTVTATNEWGESGHSKEYAMPPYEPTHVVISWSGGERAFVSNSTSFPPAWSRLTNSFSPVIVPIVSGGSGYFTISGTNRLTIATTNL